MSSIRDPVCKSSVKTLRINLKRGQNTTIYYPNEICDLLSQNNISADPDSRNSYIETDSEMRSITGGGNLSVLSFSSLDRNRLLTKEVKVGERTNIRFCEVRITSWLDL